MATRFFMTRDGVRIAYEEHGSGQPLVYVRGWLSHLELLWERPGFRALIETLSQHYRVVRYDVRGNGLSDRQGMKISLDSLSAELEDLANHLQIDRFILWGASFGGPIAIRFAADNPHRVEKLILDGTYARGKDVIKITRRWLLVLALRFFPEMGFLLISSATHPDNKRSAEITLKQGERMVDPVMGARLYHLAFTLDVRAHLQQIISPTLVTHALRSRSVPARLGQDLAARIGNSEFYGIDSDSQNSWEGPQSNLLQTVGRFLGTKLSNRSVSPDKYRPEPDQPYAFISYSHLNDPDVLMAADELKSHGIEIWMDTGITPGSSWREEIAKAVQGCDVFVLFVSTGSLESSYCVQETNYAVDQQRPVLLVYLEPVELPGHLHMMLGQRQAVISYKLGHDSYREQLLEGVKTSMLSATGI